jgi:hypothetical protein
VNILFKNNKLLKTALKNDRVWAYIADRLRKKTKKETDADPFKVLWISPKSIQSVAGGTAKDRTRGRSHAGHFKQFRSPGISSFGSVADGDWDRSRETFDQLPIYVGLRERYEQGADKR